MRYYVTHLQFCFPLDFPTLTEQLQIHVAGETLHLIRAVCAALAPKGFLLERTTLKRWVCIYLSCIQFIDELAQ